MSVKWREEARSALLQFQRQSRDFKSSQSRLTQRCSELEARLQACVREREVTATILAEAQSTALQHAAALDDEHRSKMELRAQLEALMIAQPKLMETNKALSAQLERADLQQRRNVRHAQRAATSNYPFIPLHSSSIAIMTIMCCSD